MASGQGQVVTGSGEFECMVTLFGSCVLAADSAQQVTAGLCMCSVFGTHSIILVGVYVWCVPVH